jgi:dipeptidyl aminopeptidase/acylaminoacyl peptidase
MRYAIPLLAVTLAQPASSAAEDAVRHRFGLDDLARVREVSDPRVSPDGAWVAYVVGSVDKENDEKRGDIWMTSWDGARHVRLTTAKEDDSQPRWSPDGRSLGFLSARGEDDDEAETQVFVLSRDGGEAAALTAFEGSVQEFAWSPDARRLALVVKDPDPEKLEKKKAQGKAKEKRTPRPIVLDRYAFKLDYEGYLTDRRSHLYLFDVATKKAEALTSGSSDERLPAWSPDGSRIAFVAKPGGDADRGWTWNLAVVDARPAAAARTLATFVGQDREPMWGSSPVWSPDGRSIAYLRTAGDGWQYLVYGGPELAVVPVEGGEPRRLTASLDRHVGRPSWSRDGASLYFRLEEDRSVVLARVPAAGGTVERLTAGRRVVQDLDVGGDGHVAVVAATSREPAEVFALEGRELRPLSRQNQELLAELELGAVEEASFRSKDGTSVGAMVAKPPGFQPGRSYPTLLWIHGGPVGQDQNDFDAFTQFFAAQGYVVLQPNYRGSSGRGFAFSSVIARDWGHLEVQDVLGAVDGLVAQGVADRDRLVIGGWSYGAMTTNYTIATDPRFRAAVSIAGVSNMLASYGVDQYIHQYDNELGPPWKDIAPYLKVSYPFLHADRITAPTLFMCGEKDWNVPLVNSEQMYQALKSLGRDTRLVIFPGQHHGIDKPSYRRDILERMKAWYEAHLPKG